MNTLTLPLLGCGLFWALAGEIHGQDNASPIPKMVGIPYARPETNPPSVSIEYPKDGQIVGQEIIRTLITARDDTRVESFRFAVNGTLITGQQGEWFWAPGMPQPWGASIQLEPGMNTFEVECGDYLGNMTSASVTFEYAPGSGLALDIGNGGQVRPNYQGQAMKFGHTYSMTAHPAKGFRFDCWSGSMSNSRPKLTFVMEPYLSFTACFRDVSRPVNIITSPRANRTVTNTMVTVTGKARDNSAVTNVYYRLNDTTWETAITTNAWTNWETAALSPVPGRNVIESCAVDDSGLISRTNRVRFHY